MANYVELNGIRTWYDEQDTGEPLILLLSMPLPSTGPCLVGSSQSSPGPRTACSWRNQTSATR